MPDSQTPVEVFYSYAHADKRWLKKLDTHLSSLKRQGLISAWHDRLLVPGTDWTQDIDTHLNILLLISPDFLASDYCYGVEMQRSLERDQAKKARIIPILLRPTADWRSVPFGQSTCIAYGRQVHYYLAQQTGSGCTSASASDQNDAE